MKTPSKNTVYEVPTPLMQCGHAANAVCTNKGGVHYDPPIPSCAICSCIDVATDAVNLTNRKARCCNQASLKDSNLDLAFFEYKGPGSIRAATMCDNCHYSQVAHDPEVTKNYVHGKPKRVCDQFMPHGAYEFDSYYCGHSGWD